MLHSDPDLLQILWRLVRRSFPALRRRFITIRWATPDALFYYTADAQHHFIEVNECLRDAPRRVLEGGIAHELCHIDADIGMRPFQRERAWNRYAESRSHRMREERATDQRLIELGYGPQLLALLRFARRIGYTFTPEHGLLDAEIRRAIQAREPNPARSSCRNRWPRTSAHSCL